MLVQFLKCCNACSLVPQFHQLYQDLINSKKNALSEKNAQQLLILSFARGDYIIMIAHQSILMS